MRAGDFFANGVGRKFDVPVTKETVHFEEVRPAQGDADLTFWTGNLLAKIFASKPDMNATRGTRHF